MLRLRYKALEVAEAAQSHGRSHRSSRSELHRPGLHVCDVYMCTSVHVFDVYMCTSVLVCQSSIALVYMCDVYKCTSFLVQ